MTKYLLAFVVLAAICSCVAGFGLYRMNKSTNLINRFADFLLPTSSMKSNRVTVSRTCSGPHEELDPDLLALGVRRCDIRKPNRSQRPASAPYPIVNSNVIVVSIPGDLKAGGSLYPAGIQRPTGYRLKLEEQVSQSGGDSYEDENVELDPDLLALGLRRSDVKKLSRKQRTATQLTSAVGGLKTGNSKRGLDSNDHIGSATNGDSRANAMPQSGGGSESHDVAAPEDGPKPE